MSTAESLSTRKAKVKADNEFNSTHFLLHQPIRQHLFSPWYNLNSETIMLTPKFLMGLPIDKKSKVNDRTISEDRAGQFKGLLKHLNKFALWPNLIGKHKM